MTDTQQIEHVAGDAPRRRVAGALALTQQPVRAIAPAGGCGGTRRPPPGYWITNTRFTGTVDAPGEIRTPDLRFRRPTA